MNSVIYTGQVWHLRTETKRHEFRYPLYFYAFDLSELSRLSQDIALFGYNRLRPVSLRDKDYLQIGNQPIMGKVHTFLRSQGDETELGRVILVTGARYFNYIFNPVNFFYLYKKDNTLHGVIAEVNNTFGERHFYYLVNPHLDESKTKLRWRSPKNFYVSPFFDVSGEYRFALTEPGPSIDIQVNLFREGRLALAARLTGKAMPLNQVNLARTLLSYPCTALFNTPRILIQAAQLKFRKELSVHQKPAPAHPDTMVTAAPTRRQRTGMSIVMRLLESIQIGSIELHLPNGEWKRFGAVDAQPCFVLRVHDYAFFERILTSGDIGFGESYESNEWDSDDLPGLLRMMIANYSIIQAGWKRRGRLSRLQGWVILWLRRNSMRGSRRNIQDHYDLGNRFFEAFLDRSMTYSCAIFEQPSDDLEQAQINKIDSMLRKAALKPGDHILEIGTGWGALAIRAASVYRCKVTTITLSEEQKHFTEQRIAEEGLQDRIEVKICDYRSIQGEYDHIVSVEMLEAVGHQYLPAFFGACDRLLKPGGSMVLQVITIPDQFYESYRVQGDWIRKRIFPGGHLPSLSVLCEAMGYSSRLVVDHVENIGLHYVPTLSAWRQRFHEARETVESLGFNREFQRKWNYYFSYCEAGFAAKILNVHQMVLSRPMENNE